MFEKSLNDLERERDIRIEAEKLRQKDDADRIKEQYYEIARLRQSYRESTHGKCWSRAHIVQVLSYMICRTTQDAC
jgi:hypothetical protein